MRQPQESPVSPEEAGQRILEGEPWVVCPCCNGGGYEPAVQTAVGDPNHPGVYVTNTPCWQCKGFGTILDPIYEQACLLLDKGIPARVMRFSVAGGIDEGGFNPNAP